MGLKINRTEIYSAGLIMLIGIWLILGSLNYDVRTLARMGPGYFPLMLGVGLLITAGLILVTPSEAGEDEKTFDLELRGWACVILGTVLFIVVGTWGGLVPATFLLVTVSALGDRTNSLKASVALGVFITLLAVGIFHYGLRMQFPLFTWG